MSVNETWKDETVLSIDVLGTKVLLTHFLGLTNLNDGVIVVDNSTIVDEISTEMWKELAVTDNGLYSAGRAARRKHEK